MQQMWLNFLLFKEYSHGSPLCQKREAALFLLLWQTICKFCM